MDYNSIHFASLIIGLIAGLVGAAVTIPQMIVTLKTRLTVNLSLKMLCIFNTANLLWLVFGICSATFLNNHENKIIGVL